MLDGDLPVTSGLRVARDNACALVAGGMRWGSDRRVPPHGFGPRFGPPTPSDRTSLNGTRQTVFLVRPYPVPPDGRDDTVLGGFESRWGYQ
jgi:hypothetical protein